MDEWRRGDEWRRHFSCAHNIIIFPQRSNMCSSCLYIFQVISSAMSSLLQSLAVVDFVEITVSSVIDAHHCSYFHHFVIQCHYVSTQQTCVMSGTKYVVVDATFPRTANVIGSSISQEHFHWSCRASTFSEVVVAIFVIDFLTSLFLSSFVVRMCRTIS